VLFACFALFLASLGIYGVIAYSVEQRRRELGIRAALGAQFPDLWRMVLRQGMTPALAGLAAGIGAAALGGQVIKSLLFGVSPADPVTLAIVAILVVMVALAACYIPARRAAKVDPMVALRYE
jgi:putative ABC transport system permease protein